MLGSLDGERRPPSHRSRDRGVRARAAGHRRDPVPPAGPGAARGPRPDLGADPRPGRDRRAGDRPAGPDGHGRVPRGRAARRAGAGHARGPVGPARAARLRGRRRGGRGDRRPARRHHDLLGHRPLAPPAHRRAGPRLRGRHDRGGRLARRSLGRRPGDHDRADGASPHPAPAVGLEPAPPRGRPGRGRDRPVVRDDPGPEPDHRGGDQRDARRAAHHGCRRSDRDRARPVHARPGLGGGGRDRPAGRVPDRPVGAPAGGGRLRRARCPERRRDEPGRDGRRAAVGRRQPGRGRPLPADDERRDRPSLREREHAVLRLPRHGTPAAGAVRGPGPRPRLPAERGDRRGRGRPDAGRCDGHRGHRADHDRDRGLAGHEATDDSTHTSGPEDPDPG